MTREELKELEKKLEVAKVASDNALDAAANARFAATIAMDAACSAIWIAADASTTYDSAVAVYLQARDAVYGKENTK
jgi:hypothetical protein